MRRIMYVSEAAAPMRKMDLRSINFTSSTNNAKIGVTGLLMYSAGNFMQALEGRSAAVGEVLERIRLDERHVKLRVLIDEQDQERIFGSWAMGLLDLTGMRDVNLDRFSSILRAVEQNHTGSAIGVSARELLRDFSLQFPVDDGDPGAACA